MNTFLFLVGWWRGTRTCHVDALLLKELLLNILI